ncbi:MAG: nicotinate-nucleotide diphosphorylase (carboxylating), partial [Acidimicrobiia bacterium]
MITEEMYADIVALALKEDLGSAGDITTNSTIAPDATTSAEFRTRRQGVIAGLEVAAYVFRTFDPALGFASKVS